MERFRILIAQIVTSIVVAILAIRFCRSVLISTNLINKFCYHEIDNVFIALSIGLIVIAILASKFVIWLMKKPKIDYEEEEETEKKIDMGTIKNIPNR